MEIYFIRTSGNAASLVAPPSEAAAGVPLIGLEANRRYWWVGIEDITSSLLTPNFNIVDTLYYLSMYNLQHSAPGCFVSDQMCSLKNVSSAFLYINGFFLNVIQDFEFAKSEILCPINVQACRIKLFLLSLTDCAYLLFIPLICFDHEPQWPRLI